MKDLEKNRCYYKNFNEIQSFGNKLSKCLCGNSTVIFETNTNKNQIFYDENCYFSLTCKNCKRKVKAKSYMKMFLLWQYSFI